MNSGPLDARTAVAGDLAKTADRLITTLGDEYYPEHARTGLVRRTLTVDGAPAALVRYKAVFDPVAAEGYSAKSEQVVVLVVNIGRAAAVGAVRLTAGHGPRPLAVHRRPSRERPRHPLTVAAPAGRRPCRSASVLVGRRQLRDALADGGAGGRGRLGVEGEAGQTPALGQGVAGDSGPDPRDADRAPSTGW